MVSVISRVVSLIDLASSTELELLLEVVEVALQVGDQVALKLYIFQLIK